MPVYMESKYGLRSITVSLGVSKVRFIASLAFFVSIDFGVDYPSVDL